MPNTTKIGISLDIENFKEVYRQIESLEEVGIQVGLNNKDIKEIKELKDQVSSLEKYVSNLNKVKLDSSEWQQSTKKIGDSINMLSNGMHSLVEELSSFASSLSADLGNKLKDAISVVESNINNIAVTTKNSITAVQELSKNSQVQIVDDKQLENSKKLLDLYKQILKLQTKSNEPLSQNKNEDEISFANRIIAKYKELYDEYQKLEGQKLDFIDENDVQGIAETDRKIALVINNLEQLYNTINEISNEKLRKQKIGVDLIKIEVGEDEFASLKNIQQELNGYLSEIYEDTKNKVNGITNEINTLQNSVNNSNTNTTKRQESTTNSKNNSIGVPLYVSTGSKTLQKQITSILSIVQESIARTPIEVQVMLVSSYKSRKNQEILEQLSSQLDNMADGEIKTKISTLISDMEKQFQRELNFNISTNIKETEEEIRAGITAIKKEIKNSGIAIFPHVELLPEDIENIQSELDRISKELILNVKRINISQESVEKALSKGKKVKDNEEVNVNNNEQLSTLTQTIANNFELIYNSTNQISQMLYGIGNIISNYNIVEITNSVKELVSVIQRAFNILSTDDLDKMFAKIQNNVGKIKGSLAGSDNKNKNKLQGLLGDYQEYLSLGGTKSIKELGGEKNVQTWLKRNFAKIENEPIEVNVEPNVDIVGFKSVLQKQLDNIDGVNINIQPNVDLVDFTHKLSALLDKIQVEVNVSPTISEENKNAISKTINSINKGGKGNPSITQLNKLINNLTGEKGAEKIQQTVNGLNQIASVLNTSISDNSMMAALKDLASYGKTLEGLAQVLKASKKQIENVQNTINVDSDTAVLDKDQKRQIKSDFDVRAEESKNSAKYYQDLVNYVDEIQNKLNTALKNPLGKNKEYIASFIIQLQQAQKELNKISDKLKNSLNGSDISDADKEYIKQIQNRISQTTDLINSGFNITAKASSVDKLLSKINSDLNDNGAMSSSLRQQYEQLRKEIDAVRSSADGLNSVDYRKLEGQFQHLHEQMLRAGKTGKSFFQGIAAAAKTQSEQFIARYFSLQDWIRYAQIAYQSIQELDTALVDLRKTTTMTSGELEEFYFDANTVAKQMGVTTTEIIEQAAAWSRLGYSSKEASETMATLSSQFASISPGMGTEDAQTGLVSIMKAWDIGTEDVEREIMDTINVLGNKFAETNQDVIEGMERAGATLSAMGMDTRDSFALFTGAQEVIQNAETVGVALKTLSLRIRGYDEETEELSDDVIAATGTVADLTKVASNGYNGVSLWADAAKTEYRSLKDYLGDISEIWDEIDAESQTQLLENLFGKRGASVGSAILQNFDQVERAIEEMENSAGAADAEMEIIRDSIDYKMNNLKETWVGVFQEILNRDDLKGIIDGLSILSEGLGSVIEQLGVLGTAGFGLETFLMSKGLGFVNYDKQSDTGGFLGGFTTIFNNENSQAIKDIGKVWDQLDDSTLDNISNKYKNLNQDIINTAKNSKSAGESFEEFNASLRENGSITPKLISGLKTLGSILVNIGITLAIETVIKVIKSAIDATERLQEKAASLSSEYKSSITTINDYKSEISDLYSVISDSSSSYDESKSARERLLEIQKELINTYGTEENAITSITEAINGEVSALDDLSDTKYQEMLNAFEDSDGFWDGVGDAIRRTFEGVDSQLELMLLEMEGTKYSIGNIDSEDLETIENLAKSFDSFSGITQNGTTFSINFDGNLQDIYEDLLLIQSMAEEQNVSESTISSFGRDINEIKTIIDSYKDFYDQYVLNERILGTNFEDNYTEYLDSYEQYQNAVTDGNEELAETHKQSLLEGYGSLVDEIRNDNTLTEVEKSSILRAFEELYPELQSELYAYQFEVDIKANLIIGDTGQTGTEIITAASSNFGSIEEILALNNANGEGDYTDEQIQTWQNLIAYANLYGLSLENLLNIMVQEGKLASEATLNLQKYAIARAQLANEDMTDDQETDLNNAIQGLDDEDKEIVSSMKVSDWNIYFNELEKASGNASLALSNTILKVQALNAATEYTTETFEQFAERLSTLSLDEDELEKFKDVLSELDEELANDEDRLEYVARAKYAFSLAVQDLQSNMDSYLETFEKAEEDSYDYGNALQHLSDDLSGLTSLNMSITDTQAFLQDQENLELLQSAIQGSDEALVQLQSNAEKFLFENIDVDVVLGTTGFNQSFQNFYTWLDENRDLGHLDATAGLFTNDFMIQLQEALTAGETTAAQVQELFNSLGWDVKFDDMAVVPGLSDIANYQAVPGVGYVNKQSGKVYTIKVPSSISYVQKKDNVNTTTNGIGSGYSGGSSGSSGSSDSDSSAEDEFEEQYDWIERRIKKLEDNIDRLGQTADAAYISWSDRLNALNGEITDTNTLIETQSQAYERYMAAANSVGLSEEYAAKVRDGLIDLQTITDETLYEQIQSYQDYYDKAIEASDAIQDLKDQLADLAKQRFDAVVSQFEDITEQIEFQKDLLDEYINQTETKGWIVSTEYYQALISAESSNLATLKQEKEDLITALGQAMATGNIVEYSEDWYDLMGQINDVTSAIEESTTALLEYENEIRQIQWDIFDLVQETISNITEEADFLSELMSNEQLYDDRGQLTDEGLATLGLHGMNYDVYMAQADQYADEIEKLNAEIAKDPYDQDLIERRNELISLQQDSIQAAEDEKNAIRDMVEEGINLELDALSELIDKYKEALQSQKDLYDYQKNVSEQSENIASLRKQLSAYANDDSEENRARLQQLNTSLADAEEELQQTEWEHMISAQEEMLDELYTEYEEILNARLDNIEALMSDMLVMINENANTISTTLAEQATSVGYTISESMNTIWNNTNSVVSKYGETLSTGITYNTTTIKTSLDSITTQINAMITSLNSIASSQAQAAATASSQAATQASTVATTTTTTPTTTTTTTTPTTTSTSSSNDAGSFFVSKKFTGNKNALNKETSIVDRLKYNDFDSSFSNRKNYYSAMGFSGNYVGSASQNIAMLNWMKTHGYKKGVYNLSKDEFAWTQENGAEAILRKSDGAILTPLHRGDSVLTANQTNDLYSFAQNPSEFINNLLGAIPSGTGSVSNTSVGDISFNVSLPNAVDYNSFKQQMKNDKEMETFMRSVTTDRIFGASALKKYKS